MTDAPKNWLAAFYPVGGSDYVVTICGDGYALDEVCRERRKIIRRVGGWGHVHVSLRGAVRAAMEECGWPTDDDDAISDEWPTMPDGDVAVM